MSYAFGIPALIKSRFGTNQSYQDLTPDQRFISLIVSLQGVVAAAPLAFIIPPLCVMKLRQEPVFSKNNIIPILISTFGTLVAVIGFIMAIYKFSEGSQCSHGEDMAYCLKPAATLPTNMSAVFGKSNGTVI